MQSMSSMSSMMPLYEGIALIQEKQAVVLDLGYDYTKFGFTGEAAPRCIVRSEFWCAAERRPKRVFDYNTPEELYENLVHMLHVLYFKHVLVNPKERKVVVVESLLTPTLFRETLAKVLFMHYEVSGVVFADSPRLCVLTLGVPIALVVDIGAREAEVSAVVHATPVLKALQGQAPGARAMHIELARMLDEDNNTTLDLPEHVIEDIKVKTCFIAERARALAWGSATPPAPARPARYPRAARAPLLVSGRTRERAGEALLERDRDMISLPDLVLQCIMQCPIDTRRPLAENILVVGGTSCLPGLRARLAEELRYLVTQPPYSERLHIKTFKFHSAPAQPNSVAWLGGAALGGGAASLAARALPREQYARQPRLRDWLSLLDNRPPSRDHNTDI